MEFFLTPGSYSDTRALQLYPFDLPEGSQIIGDKAYNDYGMEDALHEAGLELAPLRKVNSKRPIPPWATYWRSFHRHAIETTGSLLERLLPHSIHAVTARGFEIKLAIFVLACSISCFPW